MSRRLDLYLAGTFLALAFIDVVFRLNALGFLPGLYSAAHDPGKVAFGILVVPIAARCFVLSFPSDMIQSTWRRYKWWLGVIAVALIVGFSLVQAYSTTVDGFCERPPVPEDLLSGSFKDDLQIIQEREHKRLSELMRSGANEEIIKKAGESAERNYLGRIRSERLVLPCDFFTQSGLRGKWSGFLNIPDVALPTAFLVILLLHGIIKQWPNPLTIDGLWIFIACYIAWLPLRAYSEWWIHFGTEPPASDMFLGAAGSVAAVVILLMLSNRSNVARRMAVITGVPSAIGLVVAIAKPDLYRIVAVHYYLLGTIPMILTYCIAAALSIFVFAYVGHSLTTTARE